MNKHGVRELMDKYESGNTSLEEEQRLLTYFNEQPFGNDPSGFQAQFIYFKDRKNDGPSELLSIGLAQMLESHPANRLNSRFLLRIAAVLIVGFGIGWIVLLHTYGSENRISTGTKERTRIVLPDSTIVFLNSNSELKYARKSDSKVRTVRLQGEAYFEVRKDIHRPFIVHTGNVTTEVLGTSFNLRNYEREELTEINVNQGQVRFGAVPKALVTQGMGARYYADRNHIEVTAANANASAWKTGKLSFDNAKMADVIGDIERYFQIKIVIKTPALLNCHFTGEFSNPRVDDILKVIAYSLDIRHTVTDNKYILSGQSCHP